MISIPEFRNEPYLDFTQPENRRAMANAMQKVRSELGQEYDLLIGGDRIKTGNLLKSLNPSNPSQVVGVHHKATVELARKAVDDAYQFFGEWSESDPEQRVKMLLRAAAILRERKLEFNAWLAYEAGKTWPEAEAETAEAIDFCEFYARQMLRFLPLPRPCRCQVNGTKFDTCR